MLQLITLVVTLVLMVVLTLFLKRTPYGVQMRAAAEDFRMAQYLGARQCHNRRLRRQTERAARPSDE